MIREVLVANSIHLSPCSDYKPEIVYDDDNLNNDNNNNDENDNNDNDDDDDDDCSKLKPLVSMFR